MEKVGDFLNVVQRQAEGDLERFKQFIESRGTGTGGWRGAVNEAGTVGSPGVEAASASQGDSVRRARRSPRACGCREPCHRV